MARFEDLEIQSQLLQLLASLQLMMETPLFGVDAQLTKPSFVHEVLSSHPAPSIITDTIARSTVNLELRLHRRSPLSQLLCLLLPVILANLLSIIAFFVPSNSGQELTISTQSYLASWSLPLSAPECVLT